MIFIANTLELNGGSTFLLRVCKELKRRSITPVILVLFSHDSSNVAVELSRIARIITLKSIVLDFFSILCVRQFGVFLPLNKPFIVSIFGENAKSFHVMGIFGLVVAKRLSKILGGTPITVGVYHQNEFLYSAGSGYFVRWVCETLSKTSGENMIFLNEGNRVCYAKQFNEKFLTSPVLPVGIELSSVNSEEWIINKEPFLIISVGNLVGFKTYNRHVISSLPSLKIRYPRIRYEIYGEGEDLSVLKEHSISLGVEDVVNFCGHIDYSQFKQVVSRAHVFVGSGTAILEAAVLGVPSIVGIESIQKPLTYGFISEVAGFAYNEAGLNMPLVPIIECIETVFSAEADKLNNISTNCSSKAKEFGVERTVDGFIESEKLARCQDELGHVEIFRLFVSFCWLSLLDFLGVDRRFRFRRNQSWVD